MDSTGREGCPAALHWVSGFGALWGLGFWGDSWDFSWKPL